MSPLICLGQRFGGVGLLTFGLLMAFCSLSQAEPAKSHPQVAMEVSQSSFNPSLKQSVKISYRLPNAEKISLRIYDGDQGLVRTLVDGVKQKAGAQSLVWDGKDDAGKLVPDEAYTFVLESEQGVLNDPWTYSGGLVEDILDAQFIAQDNTVRYQLPQAGRVLIRLGVQHGPLYKTLVDWEPRTAGQISEYWNGKDANQLFDLRGHQGFTALITYVTLPAATVIAYGNKKQSYSAYKRAQASDHAQKPERPWQGEQQLLRPANLVPPLWADSPSPVMEFPGTDNAKRVKDKLKVRVDVSDQDRSLLADDQYEIIFYVDDVFFGEAERGHLPFNWIWELQQFPPGEHRLTVNISSAKGTVGVVSRHITRVEEAQ